MRQFKNIFYQSLVRHRLSSCFLEFSLYPAPLCLSPSLYTVCRRHLPTWLLLILVLTVTISLSFYFLFFLFAIVFSLSTSLQPFVNLCATFFFHLLFFIFYFLQQLILCASSLFAMLFILPFHVRLMHLCNFFSFKLCLLPCPPMKIRPLLNSTS
jgi:hypothetical protein